MTGDEGCLAMIDHDGLLIHATRDDLIFDALGQLLLPLILAFCVLRTDADFQVFALFLCGYTSGFLAILWSFHNDL